jgi:hypothetical protein
LDSITLVQFIVPLLVAIIFTMIAITGMGVKKKQHSLVDLMSCLIASISWFFFGLVWPAVTTTDMFLSIAFLWFGFGVIFAVFTFYIGMRMIGAIFETKTKSILQIQNNDESDKEDYD